MVATTIMENGIDIPNVNTIVVQDTQLFGLGQLHQVLTFIRKLVHPHPNPLPSTRKEWYL